MNTQPEAPLPDDETSPAEARLEASRARLRQALAPATSRRNPPPPMEELAPMDVLEQVVAPAASEIVRRYPGRSLAGAALAGALLVRLRPWSGVLGSVVTAALIRQLGSASMQWAARQVGDERPGPR
ncbi:MAG: hypothetical protein KDG55_19960 [Rhodocyclaceae bacterium]|nr:hypothetical protein [Rhodocyclaceae bacterium]